MGKFLVETYVAHDDPRTAELHASHSERAASAITRGGCVVRFVRSIYVPEDETCFLLFEASTVAAVRSVVARAGLRCAHISAASSPDPHPPGGV